MLLFEGGKVPPNFVNVVAAALQTTPSKQKFKKIHKERSNMASFEYRIYAKYEPALTAKLTILLNTRVLAHSGATMEEEDHGRLGA